jgi:simple sugar transport system substrate-binding protein
LVGLILAPISTVFAAGDAEVTEEAFSIGVFVPGVVEGSPTYEMLVSGVERAVSESESATVKIVEGGFNQATWQQGVTELAATGRYDLIVTSNPSMPEICDAVSDQFPDQRFLVLDGYLSGNSQIHTVLFNQREQAFMAGHFAALVTQSDMEHANDDVRVGLLAGQEYPIMNQVILPGYELGLRSVIPEGSVDFRVLGNWYDAAKASEITNNMLATGSDVILTIAGGAGQGVITSARESGGYALWFDSAGYDLAPGIVIGSSVVRLDEAAFERTLAAIAGELSYGEADVLGVADGYVDFDTEHRLYERNVPESIRAAQAQLIGRLKSGEISLEMPTTF